MKRKLLILCADFGIFLQGHKGASVHLRAMARALAAEGLEIGIACRERLSEIGEVDLPARLFPLPAGPRPGESAFDPEMMNTMVSEHLGRIVDEFPFEGIYERYSLWSIAGLNEARRRGIPFFLEVNAPLTLEAERWRELPHPVPARAAEGFLARGATRLLPVSGPLADFLTRLGADPRRITVMPNGIDESFLQSPARKTAGNGFFTVGFVGSLKEWHGVGVLLDAFHRLGGAAGGFSLKVAGDGPLAHLVREAAQTNPGIEMKGPLAHRDIPGFLSTLDVGVAPYIEDEDGYFSPMKIGEYQAAGLPVVASGGRGVRELVRDGETGILLPAGDAAALARALEGLRNDPVMAVRLGDNARLLAGSRTWSRNARQVVSLWEEAESASAAGAVSGWS